MKSRKDNVKITVIYCYQDDDKNRTGEYVSALYVNNEKVISGDEYHHKIGYKLEGMEMLLKHLNIRYEIENKYIFLPEEEMWNWKGEDRI